MPFGDAAKARMLDALRGASTGAPITHASLHSGFPATALNELSGGSYARVAVTFGAASGGSMALSGTPQWNVPAGATVAAVGFCTASSGGDPVADMDVPDEVYNQAGTYTLTSGTLQLNNPA